MTSDKPHITLFCLGSNFTCIGPRRISSYLKSKGTGVRMIFVPCDRHSVFTIEGECAVALAAMVRSDTVIGFSFFSNHLRVAETITAFVKKTTTAPVVWGGVHTTAAPEESIARCDAICIGEGEEAFCDYVTAVAGGNSNVPVENIWTHSQDTIVKNSQRPLMAGLDALPFQDYELDEHFIFENNRLQPLTTRRLKKNFGFSLTRMMTFGCPYRCTYCINNRYHALYGKQPLLRRHSVDYFINETAYILKRFPFISYIMIDDDAFLSLPTPVIAEFCEKYKKRIAMPFGIGGARAETVTKEKLAMLTDAGLITIRLGIQSGSERTNKEVFSRHFDREKTLAAAAIIKSFGRKMRPPFYDVIVDNPWETREDRLATLDFLQKLPRPYFLTVFSLTFFPGTQLYERALGEKKIGAFDPEKYYHELKKSAMTLLMMCSGFLGFPPWLYKKIVNSRTARDERSEYPLIYYMLVAVNLVCRLFSFYFNKKFLLAKIRRR